MTDDLGRYQDGTLDTERLRLRASMDLAETIGLTLGALVPNHGDAAIVYASEGLLRGSGPGVLRPVRPDSAGRLAVRRAGARFADRGPARVLFQPGAAVVFGAGSPFTRCVGGGAPVEFTRPDQWTLDRMSPGGRAVLERYACHLAVPLDAGGTVAGLIAVSRGPDRPAFSDGETAAIASLAACSGTSISALVDSVRQQSITAAMQRGLLPAADPAPAENLHVSGRVRPAEGHLVGGDWYDLVPLPGGRTGIVIGDVMGHGAEAAVIMAQLRSAARVLAQMDLDPAELLARLNRLIATLNGAPMATCVYAVLDPAAESCTLAAAGHLPPVLARPGHSARVLDLPSGLSLGVATSDFGQASIRLRPGTILAFYTDGLVETRHRSFDQGITALRTELERTGDGPLDAARDRLIGALADDPEDDVTLILARVPGTGPAASR